MRGMRKGEERDRPEGWDRQEEWDRLSIGTG
jgi:hypothetical protein